MKIKDSLKRWEDYHQKITEMIDAITDDLEEQQVVHDADMIALCALKKTNYAQRVLLVEWGN